MFGTEDYFAFAGADVLFCVIAVALTAGAIVVARTFFKKI